MRMTLEQVRDNLRNLEADAYESDLLSFAKELGECEESLTAHLSRQSDGVSEEDVEHAVDARIALMCERGKENCSDNDLMRAALAAVWHNRPAQEKAEPVAVIGPVWQLLWCDSESIAAIAKKHGLKVGDKLYAAPPAARVRVPDTIDPDIVKDKSFADGFNACRELVLSSAPEDDHD